ncbi:MAG: hypothetical protein DWP98_03780 [Bacteroidetes bacterium]|nr:MAG: hypothetical protein DWP98_03780 [Bacteroidota bacterium]MBL1144148.1 hypothetical protein [Bacteroidota bacterium]
MLLSKLSIILKSRVSGLFFIILTMLKFISICFLSITLVSCTSKPDADKIIEESIRYSGNGKYNNAKITFDFRDKHYEVIRKKDSWKMSRLFIDKEQEIEDIYTNNGFERLVNNNHFPVEDSMAFKYIESINSVFYFALLPYKLNDEAVIKEYLGEEEIEGHAYHKLRISFKKEGGGEDYQDKYIYWFDTNDFSIDYLAYSFQVNDGGLRFRKAINERFVGGIRFVDYINYEPVEKNSPLESLGHDLESNQLQELSRINLENITVE